MTSPLARNVGRFQDRYRQTFSFPDRPVRATGTILCAANAAAADADKVIISDGIRFVTYEYDKSSNSVAAGNVTWPVGTTAASNATALRLLILANQPAFTVVDDLAGTLTLTNNALGAGGNVTITKSGAVVTTVTGMSGGADVGGSMLADATFKIFKVPTGGRSIKITRAALLLDSTLTASASDYCNFKLIKNASTVIANFSTITVTGNGSITGGTPVEMVITAANQFLADTDTLSLFVDVTGAPTVSPGRIMFDGSEL